ncbi:hypothetical protein BGW38_003848 [Lunasporangiospora selenospora]|uniref:Something about silencing protein 4 domain-containing protein n=1 Tax=Lunasporangiospora selenospora TaxID=979761 RepID=A0A9P6KHI3_9FUNG|nr:hypothetical protein BGW38_003848 [Lunasporangiospora selenospora]
MPVPMTPALLHSSIQHPPQRSCNPSSLNSTEIALVDQDPGCDSEIGPDDVDLAADPSVINCNLDMKMKTRTDRKAAKQSSTSSTATSAAKSRQHRDHTNNDKSHAKHSVGSNKRKASVDSNDHTAYDALDSAIECTHLAVEQGSQHRHGSVCNGQHGNEHADTGRKRRMTSNSTKPAPGRRRPHSSISGTLLPSDNGGTAASDAATAAKSEQKQPVDQADDEHSPPTASSAVGPKRKAARGHCSRQEKPGASNSGAESHSGTSSSIAMEDVVHTTNARDTTKATPDSTVSSRTRRRSSVAATASHQLPVELPTRRRSGGLAGAAATLPDAVKDEEGSDSSPVSSSEASLSSLTDNTPQKRVLPVRSGLRDKAALPLDVSLLDLMTGPPLVPAGEYILMLANERIREKAAFDSKKIPPETYGGSPEVASSQPDTVTAITPSSASSLRRPVPKSLAISAPVITAAHVEVPIFRPCSIAQFMQEEKKRKMQLLSKALAKAEAEAAAEAQAQAQAGALSLTGDHADSSKPASMTSGTRTVSTRQKHKEFVNSQQISLQTASAVPGKKVSTTTLTMGMITGMAPGHHGHQSSGSHSHHHHGASPSSTSGTLASILDEDLSDEAYEKRHRKQEMAEKKIKNREREKLRHAMYQQQLVVEKLRHMEINRLLPISAFRTLYKSTAEQDSSQQRHALNADSPSDQRPHQQISLAAARAMQDEYHRRLLREAEENLRRYEQLGLGDTTTPSTYSPYSRTKNRLQWAASVGLLDKKSNNLLSTTTVNHLESSKNVSSRSLGEVHRRKRTKTMDSGHEKHDGVEPVSDIVATKPRRRSKTISASVASLKASISDQSPSPVDASAPLTGKAKIPSTTTNATTTTTFVPIVPPKPITTFIKEGSNLATGGRKSSRVALAFGEKVPIIERVDFDLPLDLFGDLIRERGHSLPSIATQKLRGDRSSYSLSALRTALTDPSADIQEVIADSLHSPSARVARSSTSEAPSSTPL